MIIPFGKPFINDEEISAVSEVLKSGWLAHGPKVKEFENAFANYTSAEHAVCLSSCTAGLHLSLIALGVGPGDEVIVPAQTHVATAHSVMYVGAKPVFADIDPRTYNISVDSLRKSITKKTRAVNIVHFAGLPCDMEQIIKIAEENKMYIIEDCAHAVGAEYKGRTVGTLGQTGCFSFYPIKHITTTEGGMLITNKEEIAEKVSKLRAFGIDVATFYRKKPGVYDTTSLGYNYRMTEVEAAIGLVQLKKSSEMIKKRIENAAILDKALKNIPGLKTPYVPEKVKHSYFFFQLRVTKDFPLSRDELILKLKEKGIGTSIYYATPVHLMTLYRNEFGYKEGMLPHAEKSAEETLALPVHPLLGRKEMIYIGEVIQSFG